MEVNEKKSLIESLLFVCGEPLSVAEIRNITAIEETEIIELLHTLIYEYKDQPRGMMIAEIADGFQMVSNPAYSEWIKKLSSSKSASKLTMASLETLAIVAYKQPITKIEIEQIRNVGCDQTIKTLLDRKLIKIVGRKDAPGRPLLFATTKEFLQYFGLKTLSELPLLKELTKEG
ncbi:segregation and condensation protein B [Candidatus Magnetoovum chiemensis]|nr:segregation and condensation protein B [Candidatus Magnetoovum chiemensis]